MGAGQWWAVLLSSVVYNMNFGPWEGTAWFRKLAEGAQSMWAKANATDALFGRLYEAICRDRG
eukprot:9868776-Lingulodinium_polyedra.AAC.1